MRNWLHRLSKIRSRQGLYEFLKIQFGSIQSGQKVLTIGSGGEINKLLYQYAESTGFEVISFDLDSNRSPDLVGDICTYDFGNQKFDVIAICEVLEHVHSPHLAVDQLFNVLNPGGKLILTTPFMLPIHEAPIDYYRYTKYGLAFLLRGFDQVVIEERNSYFEAIDVLWMRVYQIEHMYSRRLARIVIPTVYYLKRPFTKLLDFFMKNNGMTTGYTATAIKPFLTPIS